MQVKNEACISWFTTKVETWWGEKSSAAIFMHTHTVRSSLVHGFSIFLVPSYRILWETIHSYRNINQTGAVLFCHSAPRLFGSFTSFLRVPGHYNFHLRLPHQHFSIDFSLSHLRVFVRATILCYTIAIAMLFCPFSAHSSGLTGRISSCAK